MNLPMNQPIVRHSLDAPRARYANNGRNVAEKYGIPYRRLPPQCPVREPRLPRHRHCVEPGRVKWQRPGEQDGRADARPLRHQGDPHADPVAERVREPVAGPVGLGVVLSRALTVKGEKDR